MKKSDLEMECIAVQHANFQTNHARILRKSLALGYFNVIQRPETEVGRKATLDLVHDTLTIIHLN